MAMLRDWSASLGRWHFGEWAQDPELAQKAPSTNHDSALSALTTAGRHNERPHTADPLPRLSAPLLLLRLRRRR